MQTSKSIPDAQFPAAEAALSINERVERLRAVLQAQAPMLVSDEMGGFENKWGQGGGFDNTYKFENYS